jgi:hypothetical protein
MPSPLITSVSPGSGPLSTPVTIAGSGFGNSQGTSGVTFGGIAAFAVTSWSDTNIQISVPNGATGNCVVLVTTGVGVSNNNFFFGVTPSALPVSVQQFLLDLPELDTSGVTDPAKAQISPSSIAYWLNIAYKMLNASRWDDPDIYALGLETFAAHHVVLEVLAQRDMDMAGVPGLATGVIAGKSVGDVSISYDTGSVLEMDAGHWNATLYGKRFIHLARMIGMGPIQVGTGGSLQGPLTAAWPGPWVYNFPNPSE